MDHAKTRLGRLLLAGALAAPLAAAADDMFLKLDGVRGESIDKMHHDEIEILSYTQGFTGQFARGTAGSAPAAGKTTCGPVTISKYTDVSSPDLILFSLNGRHIQRAVITFRRPGQPFEYFKVTLEDVIVTEIEQSDSKTAARITEKVSLIARRFNFEYTAQTLQGGAGAKPKSGWDCAANAKL